MAQFRNYNEKDENGLDGEARLNKWMNENPLPTIEESGLYSTLDSGKREEFASGMQRDTQNGKPRYDLIDRAFLKRWAELMARGAEKYGEENWRKAEGEAELKRFKASALRHLMQYLEGDADEDHAVAVAFNLAGAEMVKAKMNECPIVPHVCEKLKGK